MLHLRRSAWSAMVGHAYDGLPNEACGLLAFRGDVGELFVPMRNADGSSRTFRFDDLEYMRVEREIDALGLTAQGIVHSHTHTEAYPSPTDIERSLTPYLIWLIVSLRQPEPVVRAYRIDAPAVTEEPIALLRD